MSEEYEPEAADERDDAGAVAPVAAPPSKRRQPESCSSLRLVVPRFGVARVFPPPLPPELGAAVSPEFRSRTIGGLTFRRCWPDDAPRDEPEFDEPEFEEPRPTELFRFDPLSDERPLVASRLPDVPRVDPLDELPPRPKVCQDPLSLPRVAEDPRSGEALRES